MNVTYKEQQVAWAERRAAGCAIPNCADPYYASGLCRRHAWIKRRYKMTTEETVEILTAPSCAICGKPRDKTFVVDHNHSTMKARKALCHGCNTALGVVENWTYLAQAQQYLDMHA